MKPYKVLITGGTGFVGTWMRKTQPVGVSAVYMDRKRYASSQWPIADFYAHLANVSPTQILSFARRYGGRVMYCSSGAIYERNGEYADNKRRWEVECLNSELNIVIARLFTFFGKKLDDNKAITQFVKCAKAGKPIRIWGDGNTVRSYMYGADMGRILWTILLRGQNGEAYDVGSDKPITMLELARMIVQRYPTEIIVENKPEECTYYMPKDIDKTRLLMLKT